MADRIDKIYEDFILSDSYNKKAVKENLLDLHWIEEQINKRDFIKLEKDISDYVILNDRDMFRGGFQCAWELFQKCGEKNYN